MQVNISPGIMYAQTGYTAKVAHDATTGPEAALTMSRAIANEMAKLEQQQVQAPEASVEARVTDNGDHEGNAPRENFAQGERQQEPMEAHESVPDDPLVGNLLNIKV